MYIRVFPKKRQNLLSKLHIFMFISRLLRGINTVWTKALTEESVRAQSRSYLVSTNKPKRAKPPLGGNILEQICSRSRAPTSGFCLTPRAVAQADAAGSQAARPNWWKQFLFDAVSAIISRAFLALILVAQLESE
jgi:hypothetical protein